MDRKLSINPAIKKQYQFIPNERCLSSSTSIDTPSDISSSSSIFLSSFIFILFSIIDHTNELNFLTNPLLSQSNGTSICHYYNTSSQPYFHFGIPSHQVYCTSGSPPVWHQYFSATTTYPVCF